MTNNVNKNELPVQHHRKSSKYILATIMTALFILIVWGICLIFNSFITVKEIEVKGESIYTPEQIIAASGIAVGDKRNKIDVGAVEESIMESMSFLAHVKVKIKAKGIALISITPEEIAYCSDIAGVYYVMSDEFRILGVSGEMAYRPESIIVKLPKVKKALVGDKVEFYDDIEYVTFFVEEIDKSFLSGNVTAIDVSDRYDLSVTYNNFVIDFGDSKNIPKKINKAQMLVNSDVTAGMSMARIDVSDISNSSIKPIN